MGRDSFDTRLIFGSRLDIIQIPLFDSGQLTLASDAEGGIRYLPAVIGASTAALWFEALRDAIDWRAERRQMYEREVDVPRLVSGFWLDGDERSNLPEPLFVAMQKVVEATAADFNHVGLNFYRDGADSVAPHHDRLQDLTPARPIALLSLGSARRMTITPIDPPRRSLHVELEPGSVLLMSHASQRKYLHGIPKSKAATGPRISLAFRTRPAAFRG